MLRLCLPERTGGRRFGHNFARPESGGLNIGDRFLCNTPLFVIRIENGRSITRSAIVPLAVHCRGVVNLKEVFQELAVTQLSRVKYDLDRLGVSSMMAVCRVGNVAARISNPG